MIQKIDGYDRLLFDVGQLHLSVGPDGDAVLRRHQRHEEITVENRLVQHVLPVAAVLQLVHVQEDADAEIGQFRF